MSARVNPILLIASLTLLWLGTASIAFSSGGANEGQFLHIALHASNAADYSADEFVQFAPVDPEIISAAQQDNGEPETKVVPVEPNSSGSDADTDSGDAGSDDAAPAQQQPQPQPTSQPQPTVAPTESSSGPGNGQGNGNRQRR